MTHITNTKYSRAVALLTAFGIVLITCAISACGTVKSGSSDDAVVGGAITGGNVTKMLASLKPHAAGCNGPVDTYVALDASASGVGSADLNSQRLAAAEQFVADTIACGGTVKVTTFTNSVANVKELGSGTFPAEFGSTSARLLHNGKIARKMMEIVATQLAVVTKTRGAGGTDIIHQFELAKEFRSEAGGRRLKVLLASDGLDNATYPEISSEKFDLAAAEKLATHIDAVALPRAEVSVQGLGVTANSGQDPPSAAHVLALKRFYTLVCEATGAKCDIQVSYTEGA